MGNILSIFGYAIIALGLIGSFTSGLPTAYAIGAAASSVASGLLFMGIGEILRLLRNMAPPADDDQDA